MWLQHKRAGGEVTCSCGVFYFIEQQIYENEGVKILGI